MSGHAQPEIVEEGDADSDDDACPQDWRVINHLMPSPGKVEEGRAGRDRRYR